MPSVPVLADVDRWPDRLAALLGADGVEPSDDSLRCAADLGRALALAHVSLAEVAVTPLSLLEQRLRQGQKWPGGGVTALSLIVRQLVDGYAAATQETAAHTEARLQASEARYRAIVEDQTDLICRFQADGTLTFVNEAYGRHFGHTPGELVGRSFLTLIPEPQRSAVRQHLLGFTPEHHVQMNENPAQRADGSVVWQQWINRAFFAEDGQLVEFQWVGRDITDCKRAEEALRREKDRAQQYLDIAGVMILALDTSGTMTLVNKKACVILGYDEQDLIGQNWFDYFVPERVRDRVKTAFGLLIGGEIELAEYYENPVLASAGQERLIAWHNTLLRDEGGKIIGTLSSGQDITDRKQAEEELRRSHEHLEELVEQRTRELVEVNERLQVELVEHKLAEQALRESEAKFRALVEHVPQCIFVKDRHSVYVTCNDNYARDLGIEAEAIAGRTDLEFYSRELAEKYRADDRQVITSGTARTFEEQYVRSGQERWVRTTKVPYRDEDGNIVGVFGIFDDITERTQILQALRLSEERLRESKEYMDKIINSISDPIFVKDRQHRLVLVNDAECALVGRAREEILGRTDYEFFPKDQVDVFWEKDESVFETGEENINEEEITDTRGRTRTFVTKKTLYTDKAGDHFIVGIIRDITERKQAEEALRASEAKFRTLAETAPVLIAIASGPRLVYANSAAEIITGYSRQELVEMDFWSVTHPDVRDLARERGLARQRGEPVPARYEIRFLTKGGAERWIDFSASRFEFEGQTAVLATGIDITERKQADEALQVAQERLELALRGADLGLWDWNVRTGYVVYDERWMQMLGFAPGEVEPGYLTWETRVHPDDLRCVKDTLQAHLEGRTPFYEMEHRLRTKTGEWKWILARGQVVARDERGAPVRCAGTHLDVTERKRAEELARRHQDQLAHASRVSLLGEMVSGLAHEMAQPLSAILYYARGCVARLNAGACGIPEVCETLQKIAIQAERAGAFIHCLKLFIRVAETQCVPTDIDTIVRNTVALSAPDARVNRVAIRLELSESLPLVIMDQIQIEQVLLNLIRNGIDAMSSTPNDARELVIRTAAGPGAHISVAVEDSGPGVPPGLEQRIFDPFFTTKPDGSGLGLQISRSIVEAHEGKLWLEAGSQRGARFVFSLPVAR